MSTASGAILLLTVILASPVLLEAQASNNSTVYDEDMRILYFQDFNYPEAARRAGVEGVVVVSATLNNRGQVVNATAVSGPRLLVPDTLTNARKWRFVPNRLKRVVIVYRFALVDACAPDTLQSFFTWGDPGVNTATISGCRIAP